MRWICKLVSKIFLSSSLFVPSVRCLRSDTTVPLFVMCVSGDLAGSPNDSRHSHSPLITFLTFSDALKICFNGSEASVAFHASPNIVQFRCFQFFRIFSEITVSSVFASVTLGSLHPSPPRLFPLSLLLTAELRNEIVCNQNEVIQTCGHWGRDQRSGDFAMVRDRRR